MAAAPAVNYLEEGLRRVVRDLTALRARWALVGGFAVGARAGGRMTADIDVAVAVESDAEAEALVAALLPLGYRIAAALEDKDSGRLATMRLWCPAPGGQELLFDLLFAATGIEPEVVAASERAAVLPGLTLPVATTGHLLALKTLSAREERLKDEVDLQSLFPEANEADLEEARDALALITQRGRNRGKDLEAEFRRYIERFRP